MGVVGVVIITPDGEILKYEGRLNVPATNNEAEYEGILTGLKLGKALRAKNLLVQNDSKLVIGKIKGDYEVKEERMQNAEICQADETPYSGIRQGRICTDP